MVARMYGKFWNFVVIPVAVVLVLQRTGTYMYRYVLASTSTMYVCVMLCWVVVLCCSAACGLACVIQTYMQT